MLRLPPAEVSSLEIIFLARNDAGKYFENGPTFDPGWPGTDS